MNAKTKGTRSNTARGPHAKQRQLHVHTPARESPVKLLAALLLKIQAKQKEAAKRKQEITSTNPRQHRRLNNDDATTTDTTNPLSISNSALAPASTVATDPSSVPGTF